jgi:hypothetical protein
VGVDAAVALRELGGCATRRALRRRGVSGRQLSKAVAQRRVIRLRRGVYGLGLPEGVPVLRAAVVSLDAVVSHDSAAVLWGLEIVHEPRYRVTVPRDHSRARHEGVSVTRVDLDPDETRVIDGLRVTSALRTVLDCARVLPLEDAVVVADSAMRRGLLTLDELHSAVAGLRGPGAGRIRRVVRLADPRCGSVLESLLRVLLILNGLPPECTQHPVRDERGGLVAWVDFAWTRARLIVEADGFEFHSNRADYRKDRRRANAFCRLGWRLLRFTWEDVRFDPDYVVAAVRHELQKTAGPIRTQSAA